MSGWQSSNGMPRFSEVMLVDGLLLAEMVARGSNCVRRQVGAVLVDRYGVIKSLGHNEIRTDQPSCATVCPRALRSYDEVAPRSSYTAPGAECYSVHAEVQALHLFGPEVRGWYMITTYQPCPECQRLLDYVGVTAIWRDE